MSSQRVTKIEFFTRETLPQPMAQVAKERGVDLGKGIVAVKTIIGSAPTYDFVPIGNSPDDMEAFMQEMGKEDGVDLGATVQKAFREE